MDKNQATNNLVAEVNKYQLGEMPVSQLIEYVCQYFDKIKDLDQSAADKEFLYFVANVVGVPQYYDTLSSSFNKDIILPFIGLDTLAQGMKEACLFTNNMSKIHRYQKEVLDKFIVGKTNRFFLTASTSFGKTFLVYEVLRKMQYKNVVLVFPTIALLSENLERIYDCSNYRWIQEKYFIHTLTNIKEYGEFNLFLYTPERFLSYTDNNDCIYPDFVFVDEAYKLDNGYLIDEENVENERDVAYRLCISQALRTNIDMLLAGPFIVRSEKEYSFFNFLVDNKIEWLNYNKYNIVGKRRIEIKSRTEYTLENHVFHLDRKASKTSKTISIIKTLLENGENVIVYCDRKSSTEKMAKSLIEAVKLPNVNSESLTIFTNHLKHLFSKSDEWIVTRATERGVGVHHGLVPKYIQKELIDLFNQKILKVLFVTTTITEGVNTTAKNVIITSKKKGSKQLKPFDALNIEGRAGRFLKHYIGNVIVVDNEYEKQVHEKTIEPIKHQNYDFNAPKTDVDIYYTNSRYLMPEEKHRMKQLDCLQSWWGIPDSIMRQYKVVSKSQKLKMFSILSLWGQSQIQSVNNIVRQFKLNRSFNFDDFDVIVSAVIQIVPQRSQLYFLLERQHNQNRLFTSLVYMYFKHGLFNSIDYYVKQGKSVDVTVRSQTGFVFNVLRYDAVKYFGTFNLMYKFWVSQRSQIDIAEVTGIDSLLQTMEYNAKTPKAMLAMDYGVPMKIVKYYDEESIQRRNALFKSMDEYEKDVLDKIKKIIDK